jgi:alkyl sulfatase BDS1-like metallo-beta-lactamase superfamily hydrolase
MAAQSASRGSDMSDSTGQDGDRRDDATEVTRAANAGMAAGLDFVDRRDFEEAGRGLIVPLPDGGKVLGADGGPVWDLSRFDFIAHGDESPETVNPSLWRQMKLVVQGGLYEVVPGLYQVRTLDLSNITIAEGDDGLVVFDPLISTETARAALDSTTSTVPASRSSRSCTPTATWTTSAARAASWTRPTSAPAR